MPAPLALVRLVRADAECVMFLCCFCCVMSMLVGNNVSMSVLSTMQANCNAAGVKWNEWRRVIGGWEAGLLMRPARMIGSDRPVRNGQSGQG